jgi:hypothetical protein
VKAALSIQRGAARRIPACLVVAGACLAVATRSAAEPPPRLPSQLEYRRGQGAERCPNEQRFRDEIAALLAYNPFQPGTPLRVTASIEGKGGEMIANLEFLDDGGRVLWRDGLGTQGPCGMLVAAMALDVVVRLEELAAPAPPEQRCFPPERCPAAAAQARDAASAALWRLGLASLIAAGITPNGAGGLAMVIEWQWSGWSLAFEGRGLHSLSAEVRIATVKTSFFGGSVALCLRDGLLFACSQVEVGTLASNPDGAFKVKPDGAPVVGLVGRIGTEKPLSERLALSGYLEVLGVVTHAVLRLDEDRPEEADPVLWQPLQVAPALGCRVMAAF